jgi:ERCC4-related helicase
MQHVRIPEPLKITYIEDLDDPQTWSSMLKSLVSCIKNIDEGLNNQEGRLLSKDEIAKLRANDIKRRQWTSQGQHQLRRFSNWAQDIQKELGPWCSDYYIRESIKRLTLSMNGQQNRHLGWKDEPKIYILNSLGQLPLTESMFDTQPQMDAMVSNKCAEVLSFLRKQASTTFRGIIFVDRRVTAFVLCHLLSTYPGTKYFIKCGTFVGISTNDSKKMELRDLLDPQDQLNTLTDFREGRKNLLIATTALEEGIDISACNVVICFNRPPNLKSYVQRRGRARQESSTIVLLSCLNDEADVVADWEKMEAEMIAEYMKDRRDSVEGEGTGPGDANMDQWILRADSTG